MSEYSYGWEKLHTAVHALVGEGSQRKRLANAVVSCLIRIVPAEDLPPDSRDDFQRFIDHLTSQPAKEDEGTIQATIDAMNDLEVLRAIENVVSFYDKVCRYMEP